MTIASGGAGDITLGTAVDGYQTFADAGVSDTDVVRYTIEDGDDWEIGTGVYTASGTTLVRTVTESSSSGAALNCSADAVIFATLSAADLSGNAAPIWITTPPSSLVLENDGSTAVTLAGEAIDEFPVHYSWDGYSGTTVYNDSNLPPQLASAPTFNGGTASLVGSSTLSNAGSFNFRMKASDGVKTATAITDVNLRFIFWDDNISAFYDAKDYTSASGSLADQSGQSGPAMSISSSVSLVAASSGTGGVKEFSFPGIAPSAFSYTGSGFSSSTTVALIIKIPQGNAGYYSGLYFRTIENKEPNRTANDYAISANNVNSTTPMLRIVGDTYVNYGPGTSTSKVYLDGDDISNINNQQAHDRFSGTSTLGNQYHSLIVTDLDLSTGFDLGTSDFAPRGPIRALAFYSTAPSTDQIALIHAKFKADYSSDADMAAHV